MKVFCRYLWSNLREEQAIQRSPRGRKVQVAISQVALPHQKLARVLLKGNTLSSHPPLKAIHVSKKQFHTIRNSDENNFFIWNAFMTQQHYSRWIATPSSAINGQAPESPYQGLRCSGLNQMEQNAVMYMAGLHLFLKSTSGPQRKWLYRRKTIYLFRSYPRWKHHINLASHQPGDIDSLADYTRTWSNLVDRGGLFHISNEVARLFESIEMVSFGSILLTAVSAIIHEVLQSESILEQWESLYSTRSTVLSSCGLQYVAAKGWTMNFVKRYSKGIINLLFFHDNSMHIILCTVASFRMFTWKFQCTII